MKPWQVATTLIENRHESRTRHAHPCPICGRADGWCLISEAGVLCPRSNGTGAFGKDGQPKRYGEYGYLHITGSIAEMAFTETAPKRKLSDKELHAKWAPIARKMFVRNSESVKRLASMIGVAAWALDALKVGYGRLDGSEGWSFPEQNASGLIVGIAMRLERADSKGRTKKTASGGRRGLTYCEDWQDYHGNIWIVEGGSDVAAGLTVGMCVIGRPSNTGGVPMLADLLRSVDRRRRIHVIGERDRRPHDRCPGCAQCWPGKYGAAKVARELGDRLRRPVSWKMPPGGYKDLRAWLNAQNEDVDDYERMKALGASIR